MRHRIVDPYYKCRGYDVVSWVENDEIVTFNVNKESNDNDGFVQESRSEGASED